MCNCYQGATFTVLLDFSVWTFPFGVLVFFLAFVFFFFAFVFFLAFVFVFVFACGNLGAPRFGRPLVSLDQQGWSLDDPSGDVSA